MTEESLSSTAEEPQRYVLDACTLLAFLGNESGADRVGTLLADVNNICLVHAINLCEVYYDLLRQNGAQFAREAIATLVAAGVEVRNDMDESFWQQAGDLKVNPGKLSLADCFALALTLRTGATLVTSDHHEFDRVDALGICPILFIR